MLLHLCEAFTDIKFLISHNYYKVDAKSFQTLIKKTNQCLKTQYIEI